MIRILFTMALVFFLGACGTSSGLELLEKAKDAAGKVEDATIGNGAKVLPKYCLTPRSIREPFRGKINNHPNAEGNQVGVWCKGDPPLTLGS